MNLKLTFSEIESSHKVGKPVSAVAIIFYAWNTHAFLTWDYKIVKKKNSHL